jgi:two-component system, chemotaxis family, CheB/CheR fusion protein
MFRVVGIGASAGGLESLEQFFKNLPPKPGMAFVVVQHLSPDFRSVMDELLARHCDLPIQHAEDNVEVEPNRVYLLPPKKEMVIRNRRLLLTDKERTHGLTLPIDHFFRSLAQDVGPNAVGIILSGSGSDGSRGIREIKRMGGCVFVENPDSARFDGMPLSALATGIVDHAASADAIPNC